MGHFKTSLARAYSTQMKALTLAGAKLFLRIQRCPQPGSQDLLLEDVLRRAVLWQAAGKQDIQCHGFHLGHRRAQVIVWTATRYGDGGTRARF
jgi:hypothetical protein